MRCGRPLGPGANVHHRKLRSQGGANDPENMITVCGSGTTGCHGWIHAHPKLSREAGWIVPSWGDPADVPVRSWQGLLVLTRAGVALAA